MAFRSYADSNRGFKSFQFQIPLTSLEQQRRADQRAIDYLKENARAHKENASLELSWIKERHRIQELNRRENQDFLNKNQQQIHDAELKNLQTKIDDAKRAQQGVGGTDKSGRSTWEKLLPVLFDAGSQIINQIDAQNQAHISAIDKEGADIIRRSGLTLKQRQLIKDNFLAIEQNTREGIEIKQRIMLQLGREGEDFDKFLTPEMVLRIEQTSGKGFLLSKQASYDNTNVNYPSWLLNKIQGPGSADITVTDPDTGVPVSLSEIWHETNTENHHLKAQSLLELRRMFEQETDIGSMDFAFLAKNDGYKAEHKKWLGKGGRAYAASMVKQVHQSHENGYFIKGLACINGQDPGCSELIAHNETVRQTVGKAAHPEALRKHLGTWVKIGLLPNDLNTILGNVLPPEFHGAMWQQELKQRAQENVYRKIDDRTKQAKLQIQAATEELEGWLATPEGEEWIAGQGPLGFIEEAKRRGFTPTTISHLVSKYFSPVEKPQLSDNYMDQIKLRTADVETSIKAWIQKEHKIAPAEFSKIDGANVMIGRMERIYKEKVEESLRGGNTNIEAVLAEVDERFRLEIESGYYGLSENLSQPGVQKFVNHPNATAEATNNNLSITTKNIEKARNEGIDITGEIEAGGIHTYMPETTLTEYERLGSFNLRGARSNPTIQRLAKYSGLPVTYLIDQSRIANGKEPLNPMDVTTPAENATGWTAVESHDIARKIAKYNSSVAGIVINQRNKKEAILSGRGSLPRPIDPHRDPDGYPLGDDVVHLPEGVPIAVPWDVEIRDPGDGFAWNHTELDTGSKSFGNTMGFCRVGTGQCFVIAHLKGIAEGIKPGIVKAGTVLAFGGNTGSTINQPGFSTLSIHATNGDEAGFIEFVEGLVGLSEKRLKQVEPTVKPTTQLKSNDTEDAISTPKRTVDFLASFGGKQ